MDWVLFFGVVRIFLVVLLFVGVSELLDGFFLLGLGLEHLHRLVIGLDSVGLSDVSGENLLLRVLCEISWLGHETHTHCWLWKRGEVAHVELLLLLQVLSVHLVHIGLLFLDLSHLFLLLLGFRLLDRLLLVLLSQLHSLRLRLLLPLFDYMA